MSSCGVLFLLNSFSVSFFQADVRLEAIANCGKTFFILCINTCDKPFSIQIKILPVLAFDGVARSTVAGHFECFHLFFFSIP